MTSKTGGSTATMSLLSSTQRRKGMLRLLVMILFLTIFDIEQQQYMVNADFATSTSKLQIHVRIVN
jgi:hypothetical protein